MVNQQDFIGRVMLLESPYYHNFEILKAGLSKCTGITEVGDYLRFQRYKDSLYLGKHNVAARQRVFTSPTELLDRLKMNVKNRAFHYGLSVDEMLYNCDYLISNTIDTNLVWVEPIRKFIDQFTDKPYWKTSDGLILPNEGYDKDGFLEHYIVHNLDNVASTISSIYKDYLFHYDEISVHRPELEETFKYCKEHNLNKHADALAQDYLEDSLKLPLYLVECTEIDLSGNQGLLPINQKQVPFSKELSARGYMEYLFDAKGLTDVECTLVNDDEYYTQKLDEHQYTIKFSSIHL